MLIPLLILLVAPQTSEYQVQVAVRDSLSGDWIAEASITEIATGLTVITDSNGRVQLEGKHSSKGKVTLSVSAPGYPTHYKEIWIPDYIANASERFLPVWGITVGLTPDFVFLTPPVGPDGGAFTFMAQTGQRIVTNSVTTEFLQRVRVVIPPGTFPKKYRIGISLIPNHSLNNAFLETIPIPVELLAQFRIGLTDLHGNRVLPLPGSLPIRIELAPASCDERLSRIQEIRFWRFDSDLKTWTKDGLFSEGSLLVENSGFVEVGKFSEYAMVVQEPVIPTNHWLLSMTTQPDPTSALSRIGVNCGYSGASIAVGVDISTSFNLDRSFGISLTPRAKRKLLGQGYAVSGTSKDGVVESSTYSKVVNTWVGIPNGKNSAYFEQTGVNSKGHPVGRGKSGRVSVQNLTTTFLWTKEGGGIFEEYSSKSITGIFVDISQLRSEASCPDGVSLD